MAVTIDGVGEINGVTLPTTGFGKVLQVVRATDATSRTTTSTSYVDVTGMSVTITPQKSTSAVLIFAVFQANPTGGSLSYQNTQITDSSNNAISGAEGGDEGSAGSTGSYNKVTMVAYATPASISPVTYKLRFKAGSGVTARIQNNERTGQMYAIEVSA